MKSALSVLLTFTFILLTFCSCGQPQNAADGALMKFTESYIEYFDTLSVVVGYEKNQENFDMRAEEIEAMLKDYHELYDIYKSYSDKNNIRTINSNAGVEPVKVDQRIIDLIDFGTEIYKKTDGKVNIAMGSVLSIWHDYRSTALENPAIAKLPTKDELEKAAEHCNITDIFIDRANSTVYLSDPEMSLDVGAIAKGYATEQIARHLESQGVKHYALNFGGNIRTLGTKGDGSSWTAAVTNPDQDSSEDYLMNVKIDGMAFVTSGSYERYYTVNGKNYHHIIDPATLMPNNTFSSVSIYAKDSGLADVLSTATFNMTLEEGQKLIEGLEDVEALWVTADYKQHFSSGFKKIISK